jgi:hypothetical protein
MSLTTGDMKVIEEVFVEAYLSTRANYFSVDRIRKVDEFLIYVALATKPAHLMTEHGIQDIIKLVWSTEINTDFVQTLQFKFLALWGEAPAKMRYLVESLALAVSTDKTSTVTATPGVYSVRLTTVDEVSEVLGANRWMVIILLIMLFVGPPETAETKRGKGQS